MPRFGDFETVGDKPLQPACDVWAAVRSSDPTDAAPQYALKIVEPGMFLGAAEAKELLARAIERARLQKQLSESRPAIEEGSPQNLPGLGPHWAPVHEAGYSDSGDTAFYATDRFEHSAARLWREPWTYSAAEILHMVAGVVRGLRELREAHNRAHGNLKLENIFLSAPLEQPDARRFSTAVARLPLNAHRVLLADPLAEGELLRDSDRHDLHDLGRLIYALVLGQEPRRDQYGLAVPSGPEWRAMGPAGERWRELCQRLLSYDAPSLDQVEEELRGIAEIKPTRGGVGRFAVGGAIAAILVAALAVGWFMFGGEPGSGIPSEIEDFNFAWVLKDAEARSRIEEILGSGAAALRRPSDLRREVTAWLGGVEQRAVAMERIGFDAAADEVRNHAERVRELLEATMPVEDAAKGMEADFFRRVSGTARAYANAAAVEQAWAKLEQPDGPLGRLKATGLPLLAGFGDLTIASARTGDDRLIDITDVLAAQERRARRYLQLYDRYWSEIDQECFWVRSGIDPEERTFENLERWENEVTRSQYVRLRPEEDPRRGTPDLRGLLEGRITEYRRECMEAPPADPIALFDERHQTFATLQWNRCNDDTIREEWRGLQQFVTSEKETLALQIDACREDCDVFVERMLAQASEQPFAAEPILRTRWEESWAQIERERAECASRRRALVPLPGALNALQAAIEFEALPLESAQELAMERRDEALRRAAMAVDWRDDRPAPPAGWDRDFRTWLDGASEFLIAVNTARAQLDEARNFDEIVLPDAPSVIADVAALGEVQDVRQRFVDLQSLVRSTLDSNDLLVIASNEDAAVELQVEAWRRLGERPLDEHRLDGELSVRDALLGRLPSAAMPDDRRNELANDVRERARERWLAHTRSAFDAESLDPAFQLHEGFGIVLADLETPLRFKMEAFGRVREIEPIDQDEEGGLDALQAACSEMQGWIQGVQQWVGVHEWTGRNAFVASLNEICEAAAVPDRGPRFGPSALGLQPEEHEDGQVLVFRNVGGHDLHFRQVELPGDDGEMTFLLTHEVPVGLFTWALGRQIEQGRVQDHSDLFHTIDRRPATVRTWEWQGGRANPARTWTAAGYGDYADGIAVRRPDRAHPAQWISPAAATLVATALGCRLPTVQEWQAAQEAFGASPDGRPVNLRCELWREQFVARDAAGVRQGRYPIPDADDIFGDSPTRAVWSEDGGRPIPNDTGTSWADGNLWFSAGDDAGGTMAFQNLIGNVWELVVDDHEPLDQLLEREVVGQAAAGLSAERLAAWFSEAGERMAWSVVGGSALSHPQLGFGPHDFRAEVTAQPWWTQTFADVGFRLAFTGRPPLTTKQDLLALLESHYNWAQ